MPKQKLRNQLEAQLIQLLGEDPEFQQLYKEVASLEHDPELSLQKQMRMSQIMLSRIGDLQAKEQKHQRFAQDLGYTLERLNKAVSELVTGGPPSAERLRAAHMQLLPLSRTDFPPPLQRPSRRAHDPPKSTFAEVLELCAMPTADNVTAHEAACKLVALYLDVSEYATSCTELGEDPERAAWCLSQAREGRPEFLRRLVATYKKRGKPLPARVQPFLAAQAKQRTRNNRVTVRRGRPSVHPARIRAIARMVRERLSFHELEWRDQQDKRRKVGLKPLPKRTASLDSAAKYVGEFARCSTETCKAHFIAVYGTAEAAYLYRS